MPPDPASSSVLTHATIQHDALPDHIKIASSGPAVYDHGYASAVHIVSGRSTSSTSDSGRST